MQSVLGLRAGIYVELGMAPESKASGVGPYSPLGAGAY